MGIYLLLTFYNSRTNETSTQEIWSIKPFEEAWQEALSQAVEIEKEKFTKDHNWILKSITDITLR